MKRVPYKVAGDVPETAKGITVELRESENADEIAELFGGSQDSVRSAAQSSYDIAVQRILRSKANSKEVEEIIQNEDLDTEEKQEMIREVLQQAADEYTVGTRGPGTGAAAETRKAKAVASKVKEAAANDPELAAKLAALGVEI